jgi:RND family efflux transporter MFP subunit
MKPFLAFAMSILLTAGCARPKAPRTTIGAQDKVTAVQVETLAASQITAVYRASGTVRASQIAVIAPKIAANILEVRVHAGDHVHAGQTLVVLDSRDLSANLRLAHAARSETEDAVTETENAVASATASVELARVTHARYEDLLGKASVSQQEFDESQARLKSSEAAFQMAVAKRRQVVARRSQGEAEVTAARVALGYATINAPFDGLVTERKADPGSLAMPGTPLLVVEREGSLRLETSIDESRQNVVRIGENVTVEIEGLDHVISGRVDEIVPSVDSSTRTLTAKIDLPHTPGIWSGMFGRAVFAVGKREALLVPQSAILERGQIRCVHVVEGDTARLRLVTLGEEQGDSREILSGLTAGERLVIAPPPLLADGGRVAIQKASK